MQRHLAWASVVTAFNNITTKHLVILARPAGAPLTAAHCRSPVNSAAAMRETAAMLDALGYNTMHAAPLAHSLRLNPNTSLYALVYGGEDIPAGLNGMAALGWFAELPGGPVQAQQIK